MTDLCKDGDEIIPAERSNLSSMEELANKMSRVKQMWEELNQDCETLKENIKCNQQKYEKFNGKCNNSFDTYLICMRNEIKVNMHCDDV